MAAPVYASSAASGVGTTVANVTVTKPTGVSAGDLLVALTYANTAAALWAGPAGWSKIAENTTQCSTAVFTRVADGSEGANFTFTRSGTSLNTAGAVVVRITGASGVTPAAGIGFDTDTTLDLPSITPTVADTLLLQLVGRVSGGSSWTPPGTATERFDIDSSGTALDVAGGDEVVGAGATGTRTWTMAASANSRGAIIAVNPVATASGTFTGGYGFTGAGFTGDDGGTASGTFAGSYDYSGAGFTGDAPAPPGTWDGTGAGSLPPTLGRITGERPPVTAGARERRRK
jgi:hypothetical protein